MISEVVVMDDDHYNCFQSQQAGSQVWSWTLP
jgi:hypothetical protein